MFKIPIFRNYSFSNIAILIVVLACLLIDFSLKNWEKRERVIEYDIRNYYAYLPALFIYHDIKLVKNDYRIGDKEYWIWSVNTPDGKRVIKTTMGMSILYAPFFFVANAYAILSNYLENGFSEPYKLFLLLSTIFYLFIGLDYLKKTLAHYKFSDTYTAITILSIGLGTNLLAYSSQSAPMPHAYNFCLFAIFIYFTIKWYESQTIKNTLIIGALIGLISLIRPSNAVILIFFAFYGVTNLSDLKQRALFFKQKFLLLLLMLIPIFLVWLPQFIYWKTVTGKYIYYSYNDEGFFFNHPQIINGLFSFRKGWLLYTPMMVFALAGIFLLRNDLKKIRLPIILFLIVNVYIIFSWWCWWYGGSYGQRSMIESYALLAIPFTSFVKFISQTKWYYNLIFYCVAVFFIWMNIFQTYQYEKGSLHYDGMTKELYFKQFGKLDRVQDFNSFINYPNYEEARKGPVSKTVNQEKIIYIKAINNKYVCADESSNRIVIANRDKAGPWETFELIMLTNDKCAISTYDGHFLSAELDQQNEITATRQKINDWETFSLIKLDDYFAFKACNGKYLSIDNSTFQLFANSDTLGRLQKFEIIDK